MRVTDTAQGPRLRSIVTVWITTVTLSMTLFTAARAQQAQARPDPATFPYRGLPGELANSMTGTFVVASTGDLLIQEPIGKMVSIELQNVLRGATTTVGNWESTLIDRRNWPYGYNGNWSPMEVAQDIADLGFDMLNGANNHTDNLGVEGLKSSIAGFQAVGIPLAGVGPNLSTARQPVFHHTAQGRVAMIGAYSVADNPGMMATDKRGNVGLERWGFNPLRLTTWNVVTASQLQQLKAVRDSILARRDQPDITRPIPLPSDDSERVQIFADRYVVGPRAGSYQYQMNEADRRGQILAIRNAKEYSDFAIFTMHVHQNRYAFQLYSNDHYPNQFLIDLTHELVDNGMDMYVGHGNHTIQGIEIYKGKPIFYNLGNFAVHEILLEEVTPPAGLTPIEATELPNDRLQHPDNLVALIAVSTFEDGKLREVRLYPVDLGVGKNRPLSRMSVARTPSPELAYDILSKTQEYSQPFGTHIDIENGIGIIRVPPEATVPVGGDIRLPR